MMLQFSGSPHVYNAARKTNKDKADSARRANAAPKSPSSPSKRLAKDPAPKAASTMPPPPTVRKPSSTHLSPLIQAASPPLTFSKPNSYHLRRPSMDESISSRGRRTSVLSTLGEDVLAPGDIIGEDVLLQGEIVRRISVDSVPPSPSEPSKQFEVVKRLGHGSYAVVYLVREVLGREDQSSPNSSLDLDEEYFTSYRNKPVHRYGREFAVKCLSKANLDDEALSNQMSEVTIHQSIRSHPNIAALHRTLETPSFLLLLLEYVPGEDLFYFLEQSRDHYDPDPLPSIHDGTSLSRTPPTPALLSSMHPQQLLSRTRLRLIASMFSQMCEAVAVCHDQQIFHRDIKPENFIVTDGFVTSADGVRERKVVCKLTDFGLSTTDLESSDMDCGSAPYMSYECRNNVAPTYSPRAADVWSLGIVLINMLYHFNPWTDTEEGACSSFSIYRDQPVDFFMSRFTGMTEVVAQFLSTRVFCILSGVQGDGQRISARDFGLWVKDLPSHFSAISPAGHRRKVSTSSIHGHPIASSVPQSRRPSSRATSSLRASGVVVRSLSRAPSLGPSYEVEDIEQFNADGDDLDDDTESRSASTKRRKRGSRKKSVPPALPLDSPLPTDATLESLASASQYLAREISKVSRSSSRPRGHETPLEPLMTPPATTTPLPSPQLVKKPSKWRLAFSKSSTNVAEEPQSAVPAVPTAFASNVTSIVSSLNLSTADLASQLSRSPSRPNDDTWGRGRRPGPAQSTSKPAARRASPPTMYAGVATGLVSSNSGNVVMDSSFNGSSRSVRSANNPNTSDNWRASMATTSSAMTSTTTFTRFSNSSARSVSTQATSVSASSWRTQQKSPHTPRANKSFKEDLPPLPPTNIKSLSGVPFAVDQMPSSYSGAFVAPNPPNFPPRKQRTRKPKEDGALDTISESRSPTSKSPLSTMSSEDQSAEMDEDGTNKKVQKGQINALAKMLSALRR